MYNYEFFYVYIYRCKYIWYVCTIGGGSSGSIWAYQLDYGRSVLHKFEIETREPLDDVTMGKQNVCHGMQEWYIGIDIKRSIMMTKNYSEGHIQRCCLKVWQSKHINLIFFNLLCGKNFKFEGKRHWTTTNGVSIWLC